MIDESLPPDLQRWWWQKTQEKPGPRSHPGQPPNGWWQFIFVREAGLAEGDDQLDLQDESLRVKVRRPDRDEAFEEAVRQMRERSASLVPNANYDRVMGERRARHNTLWSMHCLTGIIATLEKRVETLEEQVTQLTKQTKS